MEVTPPGFGWLASWPPLDPSSHIQSCHSSLSSNNRDTIFHPCEQRQAWHFWAHPTCRPGPSPEVTLHLCALPRSAWWRLIPTQLWLLASSQHLLTLRLLSLAPYDVSPPGRRVCAGWPEAVAELLWASEFFFPKMSPCPTAYHTGSASTEIHMCTCKYIIKYIKWHALFQV